VERDNAQIVADAYDAWNRGDIDAMVSRYHPSIVMHDDPEMPDVQSHRGIRAVVRRLREIMETLGESAYELEQIAEGPGRVASVARLHGPGSPESPPFEGRIGQVAELRDGMIVSIQVYLDPQRALDEVGGAQAR
jgi:ketosteroid isomerase-like protein